MWVEAGGLLVLILLDLLLVDRLVVRPIGPGSVVLAGLIVLSLPWLLVLYQLLRRDLSLAYLVDGVELRIGWGWGRETIPLGQVQVAVPREETGEEPRLRGRLPLFHGARDGDWPSGGAVREYTTGRAGQVVVLTRDRSYLLNPADRTGFVEHLQQSLAAGPGEGGEAALHRGLWGHPLWRDRWGRFLLLLAVLINLALFGALAWAYAAVSPVVALAFDAAGQVRWVAPRHQLFLLPLAGQAFIAVSLALAWRWLDGLRLPAYLLLAGTVLAHGLLALSILRILG